MGAEASLVGAAGPRLKSPVDVGEEWGHFCVELEVELDGPVDDRSGSRGVKEAVGVEAVVLDGAAEGHLAEKPGPVRVLAVAVEELGLAAADRGDLAEKEGCGGIGEKRNLPDGESQPEKPAQSLRNDLRVRECRVETGE